MLSAIVLLGRFARCKLPAGADVAGGANIMGVPDQGVAMKIEVTERQRQIMLDALADVDIEMFAEGDDEAYEAEVHAIERKLGGTVDSARELGVSA
jgi:hypothetical protein